MPSDHGTFVISLDFELYWGMRDETRLDAYKANLTGVHQAIPLMLETFNQHGIRATWAIVGFIFFQDSAELLQYAPEIKPAYLNPQMNPYLHLPDTDRHPELKPYYYAPELVRLIKSYRGQEIASHSFSHYYSAEAGTCPDSFRADLAAARQTAKHFGIDLTTYIFPRQQYSPCYAAELAMQGIRYFRGDARSGIYHCPEKHDIFYAAKRGLRGLDSLFNLSGQQTTLPQTYPTAPQHTLVNVPASRFFYPYCPNPTINRLRLERIMQGMTYAAQRNEVFHLWWHPHNFGAHIPENMQRLQQVIEHYHDLQARYGMQSMNIQEAATAYPLAVGTGEEGHGVALSKQNNQHVCKTEWISSI